jgi:hypothetical protein
MGPRLPHLFGFELAWADAAYDTFFPPPPRTLQPGELALVHGIAPMKPGAFLDSMLGEAPLEASLGLRVTLWMIALAPLFVLRRFATIASLEVAERERLLDRLLSSRIYAVRQLVAGFKAMGSLLYAQSKEIRRQMSTPLPAAFLPEGSILRTRAAKRETHEHAAE